MANKKSQRIVGPLATCESGDAYCLPRFSGGDFPFYASREREASTSEN